MNCQVQRKHCRDHVKGRQKKLVDVTKTDKPEEYEFEKLDTPKVFGDLVTSDSIFAIKRNSTNPAKSNETTALVVKDKATDWIAAYPSRRKQLKTSPRPSTTSKARIQSSGGTQTAHLSYIACAASSEFGTTSPTHTVQRPTV